MGVSIALVYPRCRALDTDGALASRVDAGAGTRSEGDAVTDVVENGVVDRRAFVSAWESAMKERRRALNPLPLRLRQLFRRRDAMRRLRDVLTRR